jgi:hypothetical protein
MSPDLVTPGLVRSAEVVNEDIRAFWLGPRAHPTVPLSGAQHADYMRLVAEFEEARRAETGKAA